MYRCEMSDAAIVVTDLELMIERTGWMATQVGQLQRFSLGQVVGFSLVEPRLLTEGRLQLDIGMARPELARGAAIGDPTTVSFKRAQRAQVQVLADYLQSLVAFNQQARNASQPQSEAMGPPHEAPPTAAGVDLTNGQPKESVLQSVGTAGRSFVAFDVETANANRGSICQIGLAVVRDGVINQTYSLYCRPPEIMDWFDARNMKIHGITPERVSTEPSVADRIPLVLDIVGDLPLIAHNASFDRQALADASGAVGFPLPRLTFGDTKACAAFELPPGLSLKISEVARYLGIEMRHHHDAESDAVAAAGLLLAFLSRHEAAGVVDYLSMIPGAISVLDGADSMRPPGRITPPVESRWARVAAFGPVPSPDRDASPHHPLFGQTVVVSGELDHFSKDDAWAMLAARGAVVAESVTKRTAVVVAGRWVDDEGKPTKTKKVLRAEELRARGQQIVIVDGTDFDALIAGELPLAAPEIGSDHAPGTDRRLGGESDGSGYVRGRRYTEWAETVGQLKRDNRVEEAYELLLELVDAAEQEALATGTAPAQWYTEQAAVVARKRHDIEGEAAVLQRWLDAAARVGRSVPAHYAIAVRRARVDEHRR